ncbi:MAG: acyltransferase [Actinobacteria bacterium]|nr:acyltransferase [Actinomycetota bacterium]MBU1942666.1 acyltransferase [Actinomycetota bacterium]MBU2685988.1 acyltransferase [Actinomycetota bacterium]
MADERAGRGTEKWPGGWLARNARFIVRNRMYGFNYWRSLYRFCKFKLLHPGIKTEGYVFLPRHYDISKAKGAVLIIGAFTWIGEGCAFRSHEGTLRIGRKCTFGGKNTINCYDYVEIGDEALWADNIYVVDFDHWYVDPVMSIRSQGIRKEPIIIRPNVWIAEKATVLRGVEVGEGSVIGAMSLVHRDVPPYAMVGGVPAHVIKYRRSPQDVAWDEGRYGVLEAGPSAPRERGHTVSGE